MSDLVREQLLGYLLGALEPAERDSLEEQIERDPRLRRELAELREKLQPLDAARADEPLPPLGLAFRTCELVAAAARSPSRRAGSSLPAMAPAASPVVLNTFRWPDVTVGATVCLFALLLILPAIQGSRFLGQLEACQDNLRQLGYALQEYSAGHAGYFPTVPARGKLAAAGIYAPTLLRSGLLPETRAVLCPGAPRDAAESFSIPSLDELESASDEQVSRMQCSMGGSYGYSLGYVSDSGYQGTRNLHRASFAVAADAPSTVAERHQSQNHGGRGQNVLFEDGRVQFLPTSQLVEGGDDIFVNDANQVAAGLHLNDAVIGPSDASPLTYVSLRVK